VTGLVSTYPWELGAVPALLLWAIVGIVLGLLVGRRGRVLTVGVGFGVCLTVAFLYSRFGGAPHDLPAYTAFVVAMSVGEATAGLGAVFLGSRFRLPS
jgi:hypothetical protein